MKYHYVMLHLPSRFFIKLLANNKSMTKKPTPAAPPTTIAAVFPAFCPEQEIIIEHLMLVLS